MKIASIDIGSNTVLLLIAEIEKENKKLIPILNLYRMPRLSKGLNSSNMIMDSSIDSLITVLKEYNSTIKDNNCDHVIVNATQALRVANNSDFIIHKIKSEFELDVNIIPGEREAFLSFLGAQSAFESNESSIIIDIGGASTEVIYGVGTDISFQNSFPIGVVTMTEKYSLLSSEKRDLSRLENYILSLLKEVATLRNSNSRVIAVAGTPTTLAAAKQNLNDFSETKVEGYKLTRDDLTKFINSFTTLSPQDIRQKYGKIIEGRQDIILAGTLILSHILELLNKEYLYTSGRGLRYGAVIDYINSINMES